MYSCQYVLNGVQGQVLNVVDDSIKTVVGIDGTQFAVRVFKLADASEVEIPINSIISYSPEKFKKPEPVSNVTPVKNTENENEQYNMFNSETAEENQ